MPDFLYVLIFSLIGSVVALIGGFILIANKSRGEALAKHATPFAAGALLSAAFVDLLPDAIEHGGADRALSGALTGILIFFLLERFLHWFHHHHEHEKGHADPNASLVIVGDTLHNFIDGIAIAAAFLVSVPTGVIATLAVAAHEIPQEIGDFGLLLRKGMSRRGVIKVNIVGALATTLAAVLFYELGTNYTIPLSEILGLVAGFFIYIAVSDIIPSIHKQEESVIAGPQTIMLIVGVILVSVLTTYLHKYIETDPLHQQEPEPYYGYVERLGDSVNRNER